MIVILFSLAILSSAAPLREEEEDELFLPSLQSQETPQDKYLRVDANGDNSLSFDEFLHVDRVYEQAKKEEFDLIDTDKDGNISADEYNEYHAQAEGDGRNARAQYYSQLFKEFDANLDGSLSEDELRNVLRQRFMVNPRSNFNQIMGGFDADGSGRLDMGEYAKMDEQFPFDQTDPIPLNDTAPSFKVDKTVVDQKTPF